MKPKYEIDQKVYVGDVEYKVLGILRLGNGDYQYCLGYHQYWESEKNLSFTPPDDNKYFILYRSKDGLEKRELAYADLGRVPIFRAIESPIGAPPVRKYTYQNTEAEDDGKTVVYVYEEV